MTEPQVGDEFNPNNPYTAIALLGERLKQLSEKEKELEERENKIEERLDKIEGSLGKGAGILIGLASLGTIGGFLMAYGKMIFAPWMSK